MQALSSQEAQRGQRRLQREVGPERAEKPLVASRQPWTTQLSKSLSVPPYFLIIGKRPHSALTTFPEFQWAG